MNKFLKAKKGNLSKTIENIHEQIASGAHSKTQIELQEQVEMSKVKVTEPVEEKKDQVKADKEKRKPKRKEKAKNQLSGDSQSEYESIHAWLDKYIDEHIAKLNETMFDDLFGDANDLDKSITSMNFHEFPIKVVESFQNDKKLTLVDKVFIVDTIGSDIGKCFDKSQLGMLDNKTLESLKNFSYKKVSLKKHEFDLISETQRKGTLKYAIMIAAELISNYPGGKDLVDKILST